MVDKLNILDLELLGEMSAHNSSAMTQSRTNLEKEARADKTSSAVGSDSLTELDSQLIVSGADGAKPVAAFSKKRNASNEPAGSDFGSQKKKRSTAKECSLANKSSTSKKITQDRSGTLSTRTSNVKEEPSLDASKGVLDEHSSRKRESASSELLLFPNLVAPNTFKDRDLFDAANDEDKSKSIKSQNIEDFPNTNIKGMSYGDAGGVDSEVERGATNLWSILQTVDGANSEEEEVATAAIQGSIKKTNVSPESTHTSTSSPKKSRSSFLSTVLNNTLLETEKASIYDGPTVSAKRQHSFIDSADKVDPVLDILDSPPKRVSPPKRTFRRRQAVSYDDPDATEDEFPPTLTTPRKLNKFLTYPGTSDNDRNNHLIDPKTPTRLCKTTGKPFDRSITVRATPRKRAPPIAEFVSDQIAIPTSWAEVGDADKKLMQMKEEGNGWEAIRKMWKETTGQDAAPSTLPNRYNRIKANLMALQDGEQAILLQVVADVDKAQKAEKWARVAALMHGRGAGKYQAEFLQKQFSALS